MVATVAGSGSFTSRGVHLQQWTALTTGTVGNPMACPGLADKTVYIGGTFSTGGTCSIYGSNDPVSTAPSSAAWAILTDPQGNEITKTASGIETISENPMRIRPRVTSGDGSTSINVRIVSNSQR